MSMKKSSVLLKGRLIMAEPQVLQTKDAPTSYVDAEHILKLPVGKPIKLNDPRTKFTPENRVKVLQQLAKEFNISKAAHLVGASEAALRSLIKRDETFAFAVSEIEKSWVNGMISAGLCVASIPSREGAADRKLMLPAYDKRFQTKQTVDVDVKITVENALPELRNILSRYNCLENNEIETVDYTELASKNG